MYDVTNKTETNSASTVSMSILDIINLLNGMYYLFCVHYSADM